MSLFSRIAVGLGAFLLVTGALYAWSTYEWEGLTLMITVAGGALVVGVYLIFAVQRARAVVTGRRSEAEVAGSDTEPHVAPTIWPLVFAISTIGLLVGAIAAHWALIPGGVLLVVACIGWVLDIRRQWSHHEAKQNHAHGPRPG